jgi:integrase
MASIRRRSWQTASGELREVWQCDFVDQEGHRRHRQFTRKKDADRFMVTARGQVAEGVYTPESSSVTLREACKLWVKYGGKKGPDKERGTVVQYEQHVRHILAQIDGNRRLAKLTRPRCEQLKDDLLMAHSREMARKVLQSFRSVLHTAQRRGLVAQNVAAAVTVGANVRGRRKLKAGVDLPTLAELEAMLAAASTRPKPKAMLCLAALCGLRISEIRGLRWANVDLSGRPAVHVVERADRWGAIGDPKSGDAHRTIPLGDVAARALREWRLAQPGGRSLVFGTARDKPDTLGNLTKRMLAPLERTAGVPHYGWHGLRHHRISSWLKAGLDPKHVQTLAGHAGLTMTMNVYGHFLPTDDADQRVAAAELFAT